jgi:hypothetical protein
VFLIAWFTPERGGLHYICIDLVLGACDMGSGNSWLVACIIALRLILQYNQHS